MDDDTQAGVWGMRILGFIVALGVAFPAVMFAIYLIVSSLKPAGDLFLTPVSYWPKTLTWSSYQQVFDADFFRKALWNSIRVGALTVTLALSVGSLAAYAIGRMRFEHDPALDAGGAAKRHAVKAVAELVDGRQLEAFVEDRKSHV